MTNVKNSSQPTNACKKIVFFGSSDFSLPPFEHLLGLRLDALTVVTTPDRPKGRGLQVRPNPIMERCKQVGIVVLAPDSLKDPVVLKKVKDAEPDLFVVASYGKLIPASWLPVPKKAALNIHPSLLPKYRGAAPIAWQIINGEKETGVSIAEVTKDLDAGDLFCQIRIPLGEDETTVSLTEKLSQLAQKVLAEVMNQLERGMLRHTPQNHQDSSYARKLTKDDGLLNLSDPANDLARKIRAFHPWPGAFIDLQGKPLRLIEAKAAQTETQGKPGTLLGIEQDGSFLIQTGKGALQILQVQLPGRRGVSARDFANGERLKRGFVFGNIVPRP